MIDLNNRVLVFGFSDNPERYSNMAYNLLLQYGHSVTAFNPRIDNINTLSGHFHTLTLYVSEAVSNKFLSEILALSFDRLIINPGAENDKLEQAVVKSGRELVHGCTLVMLRTNQF